MLRVRLTACFALLLALLLTAASSAAAAGPAAGILREHRALLGQGKYEDAFRVLREATLRAAGLTADQQAQVLLTHAESTVRYRGSPKSALALYKQLARLELPDAHPTKRRGVTQAAAVQQLIDQFGAHEEFFYEFRGLPQSEQAQQVDAIQQRLAQCTGRCPYTGQLYHALGMALMEVGQHSAAHGAFTDALRAAPAMLSRSTVVLLQESAAVKWRQGVYSGLLRAASAALALALLWMLYRARLWRWVTWRQLLVLPGLWCAWWGLHALLTWASSKWADTSFPAGKFVPGKYASITSTPGTLLSEPLAHLFWYGLVAVTLGFLAALAARAFRGALTRYALTVAATACLSAVVLGLFFAKHCSDYLPEDDPTAMQHLFGGTS